MDSTTASRHTSGDPPVVSAQPAVSAPSNFSGAAVVEEPTEALSIDPPAIENQPKPLRPPSHHLDLGQTESAIAIEPGANPRGRRLPWWRWPDWSICRLLDITSLLILLAVVAAIPILQLASLGYLLVAAGRMAEGQPWSAALPGLRRAGKVGTFFLLTSLLWLPVYLVTDLAYSAQLLQPDSAMAGSWRLAAFLITVAWVLHIGWSAMRGGRWWHLLWPAPVRFVREFWRPAQWRQASDNLFDTVIALQFPRLWWLGLRAAGGGLLLVAVPVSLMIIGLRAQDYGGAGLVGALGAMGMVVVMMYLPFAQIQLAVENRFTALFDWASVRRRFRYAPLAHAIALLALCGLCLPLYLLRIEATPAELVWAPSLVFVAFMLPAKILLGAAMGYAETRRDRRGGQPRRWWLRWPSRVLILASVLIYVGSLYVAQLFAGQGIYVMYFQHALLVPAPLIRS